MKVPYSTSTGVKIGSRYTAPIRKESDPDMLAWQTAIAPPIEPPRRSYGAKIATVFVVFLIALLFWSVYG
jgi:hypothetical protein